MIPLFIAAVFLSAFLLFLVQPIAGKALTPVLGGSPSVWNTSMVFFQAVLLLGYGTAHLTARWLSPGVQVLSHLALFGIALLALPLQIGGGAPPDGAASPIPWLLGELASGVGLPFLALAATGPTLQRWFHQTGHPRRDDPYFLYSASNVGSMVALLGYPLLVEPLLRTSWQTRVWSGLFLVLIALLAVCATRLRGGAAGPAPAAPLEGAGGGAERIGARRRLRWLLLAFVPSSLLLGATTAITTDIAAVPMLWVVPLAIYLLSFVLVFASRPIFYEQSVGLLPVALLLLCFAFLFDAVRDSISFVFVHLAVLFLGAMVCHGRLAEDRPSASHLTEFYFWLSLGGVLGGAFNALLAPLLFDRIWEYGIAVVLACLLLPERGEHRAATWRDATLPIAVMAAATAVGSAGSWLLPHAPGLAAALRGLVDSLGALAAHYSLDPRSILALVASLIAIGAAFAFRGHRLRFAAMLAFVVVVGVGRPFLRYDELFFERNFFGLLRVEDLGGLRFITHGTTLHGMQRLDPQRRLATTSYYHETGPIFRLTAALNQAGRVRDAAVVGLGAGVMACLLERGQTVTFYEIDPAVARVAEDRSLFSFLSDCPPRYRVVLGDARLSLAEAPEASFDLIVMDAFTSDAIPIHLITREAIGLYVTRLRPAGVLVFNVSNRMLDVKGVLGAIARDAGLAAITRYDGDRTEDGAKLTSEWVAMARRPEDLAVIRAGDPGWRPLAAPEGASLWTDDYSNLLSLLR